MGHVVFAANATTMLNDKTIKEFAAATLAELKPQVQQWADQLAFAQVATNEAERLITMRDGRVFLSPWRAVPTYRPCPYSISAGMVPVPGW